MPYIIKEKTFALIPNDKKTKVIERDNTLIIEEETPDIVARSCQIYGSTLEGRQKGSSYLIGTNYKPPIIINDYKKVILIPTHSIRNKECTWINLNGILNYYKSEDNKVILEFTNNKKITLNISCSKFDKQVLRATRLESALRGRNNQKFL